MELQELLRRCRSGDSLAWENLVRQYQGRVFGLSVHYVINPDDARDIAQEVFVKIYRNLKRCPNAEHFVPWLLTVTRNAALDHLRRRKARPETTDLADYRSLSADAVDPEQRLVMKSKRGIFYRALARLSQLSREMILLKEIQGLSLEEVSAMLNVPLGTVKSRSHRARLELAESYLSVSKASPTGEGR